MVNWEKPIQTEDEWEAELIATGRFEVYSPFKAEFVLGTRLVRIRQLQINPWRIEVFNEKGYQSSIGMWSRCIINVPEKHMVMTKDEINKILAEFMGCRTSNHVMDRGLYWHPVWDRQMTFNNFDDLIGPDGVWKKMKRSQRISVLAKMELLKIEDPVNIIVNFINIERLAEAMAKAISEYNKYYI